MKIINSTQMSAIDRRAQQEFALPEAILMERAGHGAWQQLRSRLAADATIVFVAGKGNNGGDALVMAWDCALEGRHRCRILLADDTMTGSATGQLERCRMLGIDIVGWSDKQTASLLLALREQDWIVDGIAGTGIKGAMRPPQASLIEQINRCHARICAIDLPSGLGDRYQPHYPIVCAQLTITMELPKQCLYLPTSRSSCGEIVVSPVGFPPVLIDEANLSGALLEMTDLSQLVGSIASDSYKQRRGTVALFAGATGTVGAALLATEAAAAAAAGLVQLYIDSELYSVAAAHVGGQWWRL